MSSKAIKDMNAKLDGLENLLKGLSVGNVKSTDKKPRNCTEKGVAHKAKLMFYQSKKSDALVKKIANERYGDSLTNNNFKDWQKIKAITNEMFDALPQNEKDMLIKMARDANVQEIDE
jgi:hypothetical protein